MSWLGTLPAAIRVSRERWYEKKYVGDAVYRRKRGRSVYEYRGVTEAVAIAAADSLTYTTPNESQAEATSQDGGKWMVRQTVEGWIDLGWSLVTVAGD